MFGLNLFFFLTYMHLASTQSRALEVCIADVSQSPIARRGDRRETPPLATTFGRESTRPRGIPPLPLGQARGARHRRLRVYKYESSRAPRRKCPAERAVNLAGDN